MNETYRYASFLRSATYSLTPEGVEVESRKFGRYTKSSVPYDKIPYRSSTVTWSSKALLWAAIIMAVLFIVVAVDLFIDPHPEPVALILYGLLGALFFSSYRVSRIVSEIFMFGDEYLALWRRSSNDPSLAHFIETMHRNKIDFYKRRITLRLQEISSDEVARYLLHLRESGLVDDNGYNELRSYLTSANEGRSKIGF